ncbi:hypothetical protein PR048_020152 [Dryococelus australis]|uniref:DUF4219 domain-containing protein n=1 Tax=Dryococelus australis TaxID=614101 RepID=A0ABQ9H5H3_9NEOP|nr:hypothetical protein PR048_020152 [Dryococelus australis]
MLQIEEFKLTLLNTNNYFQWSVRVLAALKQKDCWKLLNQADIKNLCVEKRRKNDKVLSLLTLMVSDTYLDDIGRCELVSEAWEILEGIHTNYRLPHIMSQCRNICLKYRTYTEN